MCILQVWHISDCSVLCNVVVDVEMGTSSGCAFFYGEKMNTDAVIAAEHDLFFKVCDGKLLLKDEIDSEIRKIIAAFVQCSEIKRFMKKHNLAKRDFEYI